MTKLHEKISAEKDFKKPEAPDYMDWDDHIRDLVDGKNVLLVKMVVQEVDYIHSMGALTNIPIELADKKSKNRN